MAPRQRGRLEPNAEASCAAAKGVHLAVPGALGGLSRPNTDQTDFALFVGFAPSVVSPDLAEVCTSGQYRASGL